MKIGLAQINGTVGDFPANAKRIVNKVTVNEDVSEKLRLRVRSGTKLRPPLLLLR